MSEPAPMNDQLVLELSTRDIGASVAFYQRFGFCLLPAAYSSGTIPFEDGG